MLSLSSGREVNVCRLPAGQPFFQNLVSTIIRKGMVEEFNAQVGADLVVGFMALPWWPRAC